MNGNSICCDYTVSKNKIFKERDKWILRLKFTLSFFKSVFIYFMQGLQTPPFYKFNCATVPLEKES